jgi:hypothetical protein
MSCHYSFDDRSMKRPRSLRKGTTLGDRPPPQSRRWRSACRSPDRHPARYSRACATAASVRREVARRRRRSVRAVIVDEYDFPSASATGEDNRSNVSASLKVGTTNEELGDARPVCLHKSARPPIQLHWRRARALSLLSQFRRTQPLNPLLGPSTAWPPERPDGRPASSGRGLDCLRVL